MKDLVVRPCTLPDVAALEKQLPTGRNRYHEARHRRQAGDTGTFLVAVADGVPAGCGEVMWRGPKEPDVHTRFPDCPELNGLAVAPDRQSRGIGTAIIRAAEQLAAGRGFTRIGLGVDDENPRAAALYLRLGYRETGVHYLDHYAYVDDDDRRHQVADPCRFLIKLL